MREAAGQGGPSAFVWRERSYVVREVLGHWHERTPWWESAGALALHGLQTGAGGAADGGAGGALAGRGCATGADEEVWRVVASAGRRAEAGTYDLGRPGDRGEWRLLRVVD